MKKIMAILLFLALSATSFSQPTTTTSELKPEYLKKSKNQKKVANVFLGGGVACVLAAFVIPKGKTITKNTGGTLWGIPIESAYNKNDGIKGAFFLTGTLSMLSSIPIYLASHRNKKKGMRLSFKNEIVPQLQSSSFVNSPVASLNLKINL